MPTNEELLQLDRTKLPKMPEDPNARFERMEKALTQLTALVQQQRSLLTIIAQNQAVLAQMIFSGGHATVEKINQILRDENLVGSAQNPIQAAQVGDDLSLKL